MAVFFRRKETHSRWPSTTGTRLQWALIPSPRFDETVAIPFTEQLLRLRFHLFFFAADERNHVSLDVQCGDPGIACTRDGLQGDDEHFLQSEGIRQRLQHDNSPAVEQLGLVTMNPVS